jgi:hypothetical protein
LLFTAELQRRLTAAGSAVLATAAHPGYASTNLQFDSQRRVFDVVGAAGNRLLAEDEDGGALPTLYAAVADIPGNSFAGPGGFMEQRGAPKLVGRSNAADVARRLWDVSEELTGVRFPLGAAASGGAARGSSTSLIRQPHTRARLRQADWRRVRPELPPREATASIGFTHHASSQPPGPATSAVS